MDKQRIIAQIGRLERDIATAEADRAHAIKSAQQQLAGKAELMDTHTASNVAANMATVVKCAGIIDALTREVEFLKRLVE